MADDSEGAIPDDEQDAAQDREQDQSQEDQGQDQGSEPGPQEQPATLGGDRPWYAQDNGMLPINAAASAGKAVAGGASRILHYLMGADSADPEAAAKFAHGVKVEHPGVSDDDANVIAVHKATELGGPAAGWAMVQYNRSAYNRKQAFAKAALNGVDGKAGDLQAAASAASQASQNVLDGSTATFTADPGGGYVTATVKPPGSDRTASYSLTPQQFDQYLDVGGAGQWDHVMQGGGVPGTLQKLVATSRQGADSPKGRDLTPEENKDNRGTQPTSGLPDQYDDNYVGDRQYPDWLEARADARFGHAPGVPMLGPTPQNLQDRVDWQNQQEQPYETRKASILAAQAKANASMYNAGLREEGMVNAAHERAGGQVGAAHERAGGQVEAAKVRSEAESRRVQGQTNLTLTKMMQQTKDAHMREQGRMLRAKLLDPNFPNLSAKQQDEITGQIDSFTQGLPPLPGQNAQGAPRMQAAPSASPGRAGISAPDVGNITPPRPANVPAGAKFYGGKWYTRGPGGEAVPVQ